MQAAPLYFVSLDGRRRLGFQEDASGRLVAVSAGSWRVPHRYGDRADSGGSVLSPGDGSRLSNKIIFFTLGLMQKVFQVQQLVVLVHGDIAEALRLLLAEIAA